MILLIGNNRDDILYFETRMTGKKEETVLKNYTVIIGQISSQTVILLKDIYTNIVSSTVISHIIEKYYILVVIKIGKCLTLSKKFKNGSILVSRKVMASDIDVTDLQGTKLGQIPGLDLSFESSYELYTMLENSFSKFSFTDINPCTVISSNVYHHNKDTLKNYIHDNMILTENIENVTFDSEAYGIALACSLWEIPFCTINVVLNHVGEDFSTANYIKVLKQYSIVGKAVSNIINELGNNEVLRG